MITIVLYWQQPDPILPDSMESIYTKKKTPHNTNKILLNEPMLQYIYFIFIFIQHIFSNILIILYKFNFYESSRLKEITLTHTIKEISDRST